MRTAQQILEEKRDAVKLQREDLVDEIETDDWRKKHPLGPVHTKLVCRCCGDVIADDLMGFGWLGNDSFWKAKVVPHIVQHWFEPEEKAA